MTAVLCIDFDSAVLRQDMVAEIAERFARSSWRELEDERATGELSAEQFSAEVIDLIQASEEDLAEFALSTGSPRPGLLELLDWTHWNDWVPIVLSTGWDIYVNPILDRMGVDRASRQCGRARFSYRWRVRYLSPRGIELVEGFKLAYVAAYRDQGDFVAYVGADSAETATARVAHRAFADGPLLQSLEEAGHPAHAFETFDDVTNTLEQKADEWLESFSSTTAAEG